MASPATASTPSSAGSPAAICIAQGPQHIASRPSTAGAPSRMASIAPNGATPTSAGASIGPTRQWVLPPRPKPGRKPATDTPPTKRKAQNRAAQRAFRERRAARVGELEEQLKETEEQRLKREDDMKEVIEDQGHEITRLEQEVKRFSDETNAWAERYNDLQRNLAWEKREKEAALVELSYLRNGARSTGTDAVPLPPRRQQHRPHKPAPIVTSSPVVVATAEPQGCGNCTPTTKCACVEAVMEMTTAGCGRCSPDRCECLEELARAPAVDLTSPMKRSHPSSPSSHQPNNKRIRQSVELASPLELDFTTRPKPAPAPTPLPFRQSQDIAAILNTPKRSAVESCGFCQNDTFCLCEAAAAEEAEQAARAACQPQSEIRIAPLLHEVTPPPSDGDVVMAEYNYKLPPFVHRNNPQQPLAPVQPPAQASGCSGVPGSCAQCQDDPKSGLFCRSLAAYRDSATPGAPDGCCGGGSSSGGCCKSQTKQSGPVQPQYSPQREPALSCAEAYKTLKSHKGFDQATNELGTWLPKLEMVERAVMGTNPGRPAYEVRAASVMSVLKDFDVRFGKEVGSRCRFGGEMGQGGLYEI